VPADGVILAVEIDAVERLLHRVFVERGAEVVGDLLRSVETNLFAERNEGVNEFAYAACGISKLMRTSGLCRIEVWSPGDAKSNTRHNPAALQRGFLR
jgi:hypothetical protein